MRHGSLFSGIGGFDLAAEWMGWNNVFHCEWNEFGQKILKHYWPDAISYTDITKTDFTVHRGTIDIITGGFPCQPFSVAGERKGTADERYLWPEMLRAIREIQPRFVVGENVSGLVNWDRGMVFKQVQTDLEAEGFESAAFILPACGVGAPHRRDRIWFIAHRNDSHATGKRLQNSQQDGRWQDTTEVAAGVEFRGERFSHNGTTANTSGNVHTGKLDNGRHSEETAGSESEDEDEQQGGWSTDRQRVRAESGTSGQDVANTNKIVRECRDSSGKKGWAFKIGRIKSFGEPHYWEKFPTQSPVCSGNDGVSSKLDGITFSKWRNESIKAAGNAIVPQVAFEIFKAISKTNNHE
jgi:DNA (cytosine-5)-methyltransferase 1